MPRELNESVISLYFNKMDGKTLKLDVPAPKADLTSATVKAQMEAVLAIGGLFDIASIKDAGITERTVTDFSVEE